MTDRKRKARSLRSCPRSRAHIPFGQDRLHTQLPPFLGLSCWSTLGRSRSRLRLMRYKASAKQLLGAILCNDLEHRDTPGALCLPYNLQENPHPSLLRNREGTKRGTPYRDGGRPGVMGMGTATTIRASNRSQHHKQYQHKH